MTAANRPPADPFPRLADALTEVSARLSEIGAELRTLHPPIPAAPTPNPVLQPPLTPSAAPAWSYGAAGQGPAPSWTPPRTPAPPYPSPYSPSPEPPTPSPSSEAPAGPTLWDRLSREGAGSRVLAWAGGAVTLAGVVLLLVLAVQRGYIGPVPRVLAGAVLGGVLIAIGLRVHSAASAVGAHAVTATGLAVCYLDVVAATSSYGYLPPWAGLLAGLAIAAGGIAIATRWDSEQLAMFVVIACAVSAPVLTRGFVSLLVGFLLVLQLAMSPTQLRKRWQQLTVVTAVPPILAVAVLAALHPHGRHSDTHAGALTVVLLCVGVALVQIAAATVTARLRPTDNGALAVLLAGPLPALFAAPLVAHHTGAVLVGALGVVLAAIAVAHRLGVLAVPQRFGFAAGGAAAVSLFEATCLAVSGDVRVLSLLGAALLLAWLAVPAGYPPALIASALFGGVGLLAAITGPARPAMLVLQPRHRLPESAVATLGGTGALVAAAAVLTAWAWSRLFPAHDAEVARARWLSAAVVTLYGASAAVLAAGLAVAPDPRGFLAGHVAVTVSLTVAALVLLLRYVGSTPLRVAGLALVAPRSRSWCCSTCPRSAACPACSRSWAPGW